MVAWTADKDQIILNGIFKHCDIKFSGPLLKALAEEIGEGCTPKAVSHRLSFIRNGGKAGKTKTPSKTPAKSMTTITPKGKMSTGKKNTKKVMTPIASDESDDQDEVVSPSLARAKRGKPISYAESDDDDNDVKRVKVEPIDDIVDAELDRLLKGLVEPEQEEEEEEEDEV